MHLLRATVNGRPVLALRPDARAAGPLSVALLSLFNRARAEGAAACLLDAPRAAGTPLLSLVPEQPPLVTPGGAARAWLDARWRLASAADTMARARDRGLSAFWLEWHKELRRHVADETLPLDVRGRLRDGAHRSIARSTAAAPVATPFPRRALRDRVRAALAPDGDARARALAAAAGIPDRRPIVALDVRRRPEAFAPAISWLAAQGYAIVRIGESLDPLAHPDAIETPRSSPDAALLDLFVLLTARFVICESRDVQHTAYLTATSSLLLNARDPFRGYPVRDDALFTLRTIIDLDTGAEVAPRELLEERHYRRGRALGFRDNSAGEIVASVQEMHEGVTSGWRDAPSQAAFRTLVTDAGAALASRVPLVAEWGPDDGFIGDGRLVRWQAERV